MELYGLIAVLVVLIPEWLADGTLNLGQAKGPASLPMRSSAWRTLPELRLAAMTLAELRQAAAELRLYHYDPHRETSSPLGCSGDSDAGMHCDNLNLTGRGAAW